MSIAAKVFTAIGGRQLLEKGVELIDDLVVTESEKRQAEADADVAQIQVNKTEAAHASVFVAGWRPFIGWTGGIGIAYIYLIGPVLEQVGGYPVVEVDGAMLLALVGTMLGNAGLRTWEKHRGVAREKVRGK